MEGCPGLSPVLAVTRGVTYTLLQHHLTNWGHPLGERYMIRFTAQLLHYIGSGLAYYPDGAHGWVGFASVPEMEVLAVLCCRCRTWCRCR